MNKLRRVELDRLLELRAWRDSVIAEDRRWRVVKLLEKKGQVSTCESEGYSSAWLLISLGTFKTMEVKHSIWRYEGMPPNAAVFCMHRVVEEAYQRLRLK